MSHRLLLAGLLLMFVQGLCAAGGEAARNEALFQARCAGLCHQTPVKNRLNAKQWRVVLKTMQTRMHGSGMTPLTVAESESIYAYLTDGKTP